jgi:hypothetical protein
MLAKIDTLTSQYRKATLHPDGSLTIGSENKRLSLLENFKIEELISDFNLLCNLPPYLLRTSIFPRDNIIQVDEFLKIFDIWVIKTINFFSNHFSRRLRTHDLISAEEYRNVEVFESLLLVDLDRISSSIKENTSLGMVINALNDRIFPCFVYPFLEGLVRKECKGILNIDGTIANIDAFPPEIKGKYEGKKQGFQVSNIGHELLLLTTSSTNPLKNIIEKTLQEFAKCIDSPDDPYTTIKNARNGILHGDIGYKGAITAKYIVFLILLSRINEAEFKKEVQKINYHNVIFW